MEDVSFDGCITKHTKYCGGSEKSCHKPTYPLE